MKRSLQEYNNIKVRQVITALLLTLLWIIPPQALAENWKVLAPGIEYQDLGFNLVSPWSHIHVFRIDLKTNRLDLVMARQFSQPHAPVAEFARRSNALIASNGGFFDKNFHPLGLRIGRQKQYNPAKPISWWGIFYIKDQKPYVTHSNRYAYDKNVDFAVQSGPRLLVQGKIPSLKPGIAERTALGITPDDRVILLVTENNPLTTQALAELLKSQPLDCTNALNLDGGSSSQLAANIDSFQIQAQNFSDVTDAVVVLPRSLNP